MKLFLSIVFIAVASCVVRAEEPVNASHNPSKAVYGYRVDRSGLVALDAALVFVFGNTYYVRPDGSPNCTGLVNQPYTGLGIDQPCAWASLQMALDLVQPGDVIVLRRGVAYVGNYRLRNRNATATDQITITTEGFSVPAGQRVTKADDPAMARILAPGNGLPAIEADAGAGFYNLIGLYISADYGSDPTRQYGSNVLIALNNGNNSNPSYGSWLSHDVTVDRSHVAGKFGDSRFAFSISGFNFKFLNSVVDEFANPPGNDSAGFHFFNAGGHLIENSLVSAGMWCIDMGGADSDSPNRAKVASATVNSATLSGMEGTSPIVGALIAFYIRPSGGESTWQANTSYPLGTLQFHHSAWTKEVGKPPLLFYTTQAGTSGTTEPDWNSFDEYHNQTKPDGSVIWRLFNGDYQVGKIATVGAAVNGLTPITFTPEGPTGIFLPPVVGSIAKWNGYSPSLTVRRSYFLRPKEWANFNAPNKGMVQVKNGSNLTWEANTWDVQPGQSPDPQFNLNHRPGLFALTPGNQSYSAPWSTDQNIVFRYSVASNVESVFNFALTDYTKTNVPGGNILVEHNLFKDVWHGFVTQVNGGYNVTFRHNTVLNQSEPPLKLFDSKITGLTFEDNIVGWHQGAYLQWGDLFSQNVNGGSEKNNVFIDVNNRAAEGYPPNKYFPNSVYTRNWADVKIQPDGRLAPDSPYKGKGSDGKDPGADISLIEAAMGGKLPAPTPTPSASPTPLPSPSPAPTATPPNSQTVNIQGYVWAKEVTGDARVVGATVTVGSQSVQSRADGGFSFANVIVGAQVVTTKAGYTFPNVTVTSNQSEQLYFVNGAPVASSTPSPTPVPTPSPTPTPSPSPSATPSCTMTIQAPTLTQGGSGILKVTISSLIIKSFTVTAIAAGGQVTVSAPTSKSFSNVTGPQELNFKIQAKKKEGWISVSGPCGSESVLVNVQ